MTLNRIVKQLREESTKYEGATMMLPVEVIDVINGDKVERELGYISEARVIRWVADMLEE